MIIIWKVIKVSDESIQFFFINKRKTNQIINLSNNFNLSILLFHTLEFNDYFNQTSSSKVFHCWCCFLHQKRKRIQIGSKTSNQPYPHIFTCQRHFIRFELLYSFILFLGGPMYKVVVESPAFKEKTKLEQHKMVMDALSDDMDQIHAINVKTRTPSELNVMSLGLGIMP